MKAVRTLEPTILGSYGYAWRQLGGYFLHLFLVAVIVSFFNAAPYLLLGLNESGAAAMTALLILLTAYRYLIWPIIDYGADLVNLRCMRGERVDLTEMFDGFRSSYLGIVLAYLLASAIVGLGIALFIIPGIIFACRLVFVPYLVMDKKLDPVGAVEKSWNMTRGHTWRILGMFLIAIVLYVVGFLLLFVGTIFAFIWTRAAFASLYHAIDSKERSYLDANGDEQAAEA